jgi:hypothetical protein
MDGLSIQDSTNSDARYNEYSSTSGTLNTSMNSRSASSGGARLSAGADDDRGWQTAPATRARRGVASSTGANSSGISIASSSTIVHPPIGRKFDQNAYGKPKAPASVGGSIAYSSWSTPAGATAADSSNRKFAKVKAHKKTEEKMKEKWAGASQSIVSGLEGKIFDPEWDSDKDNDSESSDDEDSDDSDD